MSAAHCLLYQSRARGTAPLKDVQVNGGPQGIKVIWAQKYMPCLTCEQGKTVRQNGGKDMDRDIEKLKQIHGKQIAELPQVISPKKSKRLERLDKLIEVVKEHHLGHRTCERCGWTGPEKNFHMAGLTGHVNICRRCVAKKRAENKAKGKEQSIVDPLTVVLDFSTFPWILESLQVAATANYRTVQNEIFFRVVSNG
jgi:hypothetical protein